ncbi:MAG: carboxymuconolactone decarboxylase family protein [Granulosicoccus sp.]
MSRLATRSESDLQAETLDALSAIRRNGRIPEVYLQFANSESALRAYLQMERCILLGSLSNTEAEAVKLWLSQKTGCDFCLSVHWTKTEETGLSHGDRMAIRTGSPTSDKRIDILLQLSEHLFTTPGALSENLLNQARDAGVSDQNLVDLTMLLSTIFFTNITNHINDTRSSLPPAPPLESQYVTKLTRGV